MKLFLPLPLLLLFSASGDLQFWRERIVVDILPPDTVQVTGTYFFRSRSGRQLRRAVLYPFPHDSTALEPDTVMVSGPDGSPIRFRQETHAVSFPVHVPENGVCSLTVVYRQRFRGSTGRYILTTTKTWNEPLGPSTFSVSVPDSLILTHVSYVCDTMVQDSGRTTCRFRRDRFMPERDFVFSWE